MKLTINRQILRRIPNNNLTLLSRSQLPLTVKLLRPLGGRVPTQPDIHMPDVADPVGLALLAVVLVDEVLAQVRRVDDFAVVELPWGRRHRQGVGEGADAAGAGAAAAVVHDVCAWWVVVWVSVEGVGYLWDNGADGRLFGGVVVIIVVGVSGVSWDGGVGGDVVGCGSGVGLVLFMKLFDVIPFAGDDDDDDEEDDNGEHCPDGAAAAFLLDLLAGLARDGEWVLELHF